MRGNDTLVTRYRIDPDRSVVRIAGRSNVHPIHSEARGLEGWVELEIDGDGRVDPAAPPAAHLEFPVSRLRSGNPLETRELRRRIRAREFPTITGDLSRLSPGSADGRYLIAGEVTFLGTSRRYEHEMDLVLDDGTLHLTGEADFDIRHFGMDPPRILMLAVEPVVRVAVEIAASV